MSQVGKYLNLKPHMQSWSVYNENGPYTTAHAIGSLAPAQFGGLSYEILAEKGGDVYVIQTESFGRCAIWAPRDNDSSITSTPAYTNGGSSGGGGTGGTGKYLNLHPHMQSWSVYNENGPYTTANAIGSLSPAQFGGLSYEILAEKGGDVYIIQTESFGRCAIWAPADNDSSITSSPIYQNGDISGGGGTGGTGKYLNLHPHMQSWAVYNENGPYTTDYAIGSLAPAQYGGLSYEILAEKGGDVYVIQTESFGRCAIWAPTDNDSSITSSPAYPNDGSSGGGGTGGGNGGVEIPGGLKVFIDPGHGGSDPGASGNGLQEKNIVLSIAKKLGVILNSYGISVKYSRETDTFVDLESRAQQANSWGANLFVSIHANSSTASSASGTECYTKPAADSKTKQLSANVAKSISSKLGIPNRGHKEEVWRVLMSSNMPAILVETAFISNSSDANLLKNRQDDFANVIFNEIYKYLGYPVTNISLINELASLAVRYCSMNSLLGIKSINKCILDYLRHIRYDDSEWKIVLGDISPFVEYIKTNYTSIHNKFLPYIQNDPKDFNIHGFKIDLAHLAATTLGYINSILDHTPSIAIPNFWTGWGGDLATALRDITKLKQTTYKNESEQNIADKYVTGKDSSFSKIDIDADIDAIQLSKSFTTKRFDILLDNFYSSLTSQKRKEIILINDLGFNNTSNLTIDYISLAIREKMTGSQGFGHIAGFKLLNKATYEDKKPTNAVYNAGFNSFAKYLYNL